RHRRGHRAGARPVQGSAHGALGRGQTDARVREAPARAVQREQPMNLHAVTTNHQTTSDHQVVLDPENPWLGLFSYTEETRAFFHGRDEETAELARRVQHKILTVLFGQSGLGKTSLLRAGLVPRLRKENYCPVYVRIDYADGSPAPAEQIKRAVFRATAAAGHWTRPGASIEGESLWEFLHHRGDLLRDADGHTLMPLLIFDQFEEIFTLGQADDAGKLHAHRFLEDLADLVENRAPTTLEARMEQDDNAGEDFDFARADYRVLIALREDYLAHLEGIKDSMPSITQNRMRLARMSGEQALSAVLKPGAKLVTPEVAEAIVRFVAGGAELKNAEIEPSLLSLVCRELNTIRQSQHRKDISTDLLAGSPDTILSEFYERALADPPEGVRRLIADRLLTESGYRESLAEERVLKALAAVAGLGKQLVLDYPPDAYRLVGQRAFVEFAEDGVARTRQQVGRDVLAVLGLANGVELAADEAQQRGFDLGVLQLRAAGHEAHDRFGDFRGHKFGAGLQHCAQGLLAAHPRQAHAVLGDRGHAVLDAFQMREVILAQRDQDAVVGTGEVEILAGVVVLLHPRFQRRRGAVFDEVGQVFEKPVRVQLAGIVGLP